MYLLSFKKGTHSILLFLPGLRRPEKHRGFWEENDESRNVLSWSRQRSHQETLVRTSESDSGRCGLRRILLGPTRILLACRWARTRWIQSWEEKSQRRGTGAAPRGTLNLYWAECKEWEGNFCYRVLAQILITLLLFQIIAKFESRPWEVAANDAVISDPDVASGVDQKVFLLVLGQAEGYGMSAASDDGRFKRGHSGKVNLEVVATIRTDDALVAKIKVGRVEACAAI